VRTTFQWIVAVQLLLFSPEGRSALTNQWRALATGVSGHVGVAALLVESGENVAMNGWRRFPMQSVYKLPIAMSLLQKVDERKLSLDQVVDVTPDEYISKGQHSPLRDQFPAGTQKTIRDLIRYALVESDGTASDVLLRLLGGPQTVTSYVRSLGVGDLIVANSEMDMTWQRQYDDWCTPEAAAQLLAALEKGKGVSTESRALILQDMQETKTGMNRIRHLLPSGTVVADKTGASGTKDGLTAATNDIALVNLPDGRHLALAIFVADSTASDNARDDLIAKLARAAWDAWVSRDIANRAN
jgi:beta-lactamase class A